jgi:hypothetical protein
MEKNRERPRGWKDSLYPGNDLSMVTIFQGKRKVSDFSAFFVRKD